MTPTRFSLKCMATAAVIALVPPALAQTVPAPAPGLTPLAGYRPWADVAPVDWRAANDTVRRIGGWRSYAREAAPERAAPAAGASTPARPDGPPPAPGARP